MYAIRSYYVYLSAIRIDGYSGSGLEINVRQRAKLFVNDQISGSSYISVGCSKPFKRYRLFDRYYSIRELTNKVLSIFEILFYCA